MQPMGCYGGPTSPKLERPAVAAAKSFVPPPPATREEEEQGVRVISMDGTQDGLLDKLSGLAGFMVGQVIPMSWWLPGKEVPP